MADSILVATWNMPHRLDKTGNRRESDLERLRDKGVGLVGTQEFADIDATRVRPSGYRVWRPKVARSACVYWDPSMYSLLRRGAFKLSSDNNPTGVRYIVWVFVQHKQNKRRYRFGALHFPAFKTSRPKNAKEFRHQEERAATWLERGPRRVLVGDYNAGADSKVWMPNMNKVGIYGKPIMVTTNKGLKIDHVFRRKDQERPVNLYTLKGVSDHRALVARVIDK
jgi:endonuclease/exonuclease/phosphatase family metal-dependent hydrolase